MLKQIIYSIARTQFQQSFAFLASILAVLILLLSTPVFAQSQTISNRGRLEIALKLIQEQRLFKSFTVNHSPSCVNIKLQHLWMHFKIFIP